MKKTISILLTLCMIVAMLPTAMAAKKATFKDVPEDMWCFDYVEYVAEEGYFKGTTATTFEPNGPMTRQQFVVVLSRMVNAKVNNNQSPFSDVPAGSYSAGAIAWAAKHGITQGYEDGTFRPTEPITRQQMCAFMNRFMTYYANNYGVRYISKNGKINFDDKADIAAYAKSAVDYCVKYGLILGYEDGTFRPAANATRAHVAAIIQRLDKITRKSSGGGGGVVITPTTTTYTVTYQKADGSTLYVDSYEENATVTVRIAEPDTTEQTFAGWYVVSGDNADTTYAGTGSETFTITQNTVLKATWNEKNDLLKTAFVGEDGTAGVVGYVNDNLYSRYANAQGVVQIDSLVVDEVDYDFSGTKREIEVNASGQLMDDTVYTLVKRAVDYAVALVKSTEPAADELAADYETVKDTVKDVVAALGLTWTGKDIEALAKEIYEQGKDAAYDIWDFFQADGEYIFETADVIVAGETVFSITSATKSTSLGAKASAKALAKAIAEELYADLKTETTPDDKVELTTSVTMKFNDVAKNPNDQEYPTEYTMVANMTFTSDVVSYYYENDTHNFIVTISKDWQTSYDAAMQTVADEALAAVKAVLSQKLNGMLDGYLSGSSMDSMIAQLVEVGIYADADEANAAITAVANSAANAWIAKNLGTAETPAGANYYLPYDFFWLQNGQIEISGNDYILTINGADTGRQLFDNDVLLDPIEAWADNLVASISVSALVTDEMDKTVGGETVRETYQKEIVSEFKAILEDNIAGSYTYADFLALEGNFQKMFGYANKDAMFASGVALADQIAAIDLALSQDLTDNGTPTVASFVQDVMLEVLLGDGTNPGMLDGYYNNFVGGMNSIVTDMITACDLKAYLLNLVLTDLGLGDFAAQEYVVDAAVKNAAIQNYLNNYIDNAINSAIKPDDIADMIDEQIVSIVSTYSSYLQYLPYLQSVNTFDELASAKVSNLTTALASDELQTLIAKAEISTENMTKALNAMAKAIEKLPAKASIEVNGVKISESELSDVKAAAENHDLALVCDELADLLSGLNGLSLNSINKLPMTVTYGDRSENASLTVVIEQ